jgi:hypothetical protein
MSRVDELLTRYIAEHSGRGDADPGPYLGEVTGTDRAELAAMIDRYLAEAPPPAFDQEQFAGFREDPRWGALVERILALSLEKLRTDAEVTKQQVGTLLASELDLAGHEPGLKRRYHDLEAGNIDPERVAPGVWGALSNAFSQSVDRLKDGVAIAREATTGSDELVAFARQPLPPDHGAQSREFEKRPETEEVDPVDAAFFQDE